MKQNKPHIPVLLDEILKFFEGVDLRIFFEGTLGAAGHASKILEEHKEIKKYIGCDVDPDALHLAEKNLSKWKNKIELVQTNFQYIDEVLEKKKISKVNGVLFDVGISSMQLEKTEKGFSFKREGPLDMRMDPQLRITAHQIVNRFSEKKLAEIIRDFGEESQYRKAARAIVDARRKKTIDTTAELAELLKKVCRGKKHLHPATKVFQALRIYVNEELKALRTGVEKAIDALAPKGRIGVICFHSLEDRIVKEIFRERNKKDGKILTKKPIVPTKKEIISNPRSRSAKLRFFEKE